MGIIFIRIFTKKLIGMRQIGITLSLIKEIKKQLEEGKTVLLVGTKSPDLYLRMLSCEGCEAIAEKCEKGFNLKLK